MTESVTECVTECVTDSVTECVTDSVTDSVTECVTECVTDSVTENEKKVSFIFPETYIYYRSCIYLKRYTRKMCTTIILWV